MEKKASNMARKTDSVFTPVAKKDVLTRIDIYQRTEDRYDQRAILVCHFKRKNADLSAAAGHHSDSITSTRYVKIAAAPFDVHSDAEGVISIDADSYNPHWRMLMSGRIKQIRVTSYSDYHGSESAKKLGILSQVITFKTEKFGELSYTRYSHTGDWWDTAEQCFARVAKVFPRLEHDFCWHSVESPIVWVGGESLEAIRADQASGRERERETLARLEQYRREAEEKIRAGAQAAAEQAQAENATRGAE